MCSLKIWLCQVNDILPQTIQMQMSILERFQKYILEIHERSHALNKSWVKIHDEEKQTLSILQLPLRVLPQHSISDPGNIMPTPTCIEHLFPEEFGEKKKKGNRKTETTQLQAIAIVFI